MGNPVEKSPLYISVQTGNFNIAEGLIKRQYYDNVNEVVNNRSLLTVCVEARGTKMAQALIKLGADITHNNYACVKASLYDKEGSLFMHFLNHHFHPDFLNLTTYYGDWIGGKHINKEIPLLSASIAKDMSLSVISKLLALGFDINQVEPESHMSPIFFCQSPETLDFLLKNGANLNQKTKDGQSIEQSINNFYLEKKTSFLKVLSQYKNIPQAKSLDLFVYAEKSHDLKKFSDLLNKKNNDLSGIDDNGQTVTQALIRNRHYSIIRSLVKHDKIDLLQRGQNTNDISNFASILYFLYFTKTNEVTTDLKNKITTYITSPEKLKELIPKLGLEQLTNDLIAEHKKSYRVAYRVPDTKQKQNFDQDPIIQFEKFFEEITKVFDEPILYFPQMEKIFEQKDHDAFDKGKWLAKEIDKVNNLEKRHTYLDEQQQQSLINLCLNAWLNFDEIPNASDFIYKPIEQYLISAIEEKIPFTISSNMFLKIKNKTITEEENASLATLLEKKYLEQDIQLSSALKKQKVL